MMMPNMSLSHDAADAMSPRRDADARCRRTATMMIRRRDVEATIVYDYVIMPRLRDDIMPRRRCRDAATIRDDATTPRRY